MITLRKSAALTLSVLMLAGCSEKTPEQPATAPAPVAASDPATTIYANGNIITVNEQHPTAEAVAVRDGKILAVGSQVEVETAAGDNTTLKDLQGHTLLPGFIDGHGHITYTNQLQLSANIASPPVGQVEDINGLVAALKAHQQAYPQSPWVVGFGYDDSLMTEKRHPTRAELDQVSTELPVAVTHVSGHLMSCNSRCLEFIGINADTANPAGGIIRRQAGSSEPDGVLEETAMYIAMKAMPAPDLALLVKLMAKTQRDYASYGITTVQDGAASSETIGLLKATAQQGGLYLDVVAYPHNSIGLEGMKKHPPSKTYDNGFRVGGIKLTLDGSPQGKTAWLTKPYFHPPHGQAEGYVGYPSMTDEQVQEYVNYAYSNNIQLLAHANGDAASDQMLKTTRAAREQFGDADRRAVMIHAQTVREDQIDGMLEEGIIPSYFVAHTFYWGDWHRDSVFGEERASRISPLRSSTDKGLRYTIHNDTPVVPADMMRLLWTAVNRVTRSGKVLGTEQRATVMEGIRGMTIDGAYQFFEEDSKGSIEVGKRADLIVLDQNPLETDPMLIKDIAILETIKDGNTVFSR